MKITKIDVLICDAQEQRAYRKPIVCRVYTDEGIYGDGEAGIAYGYGSRAAYGMVQDLAQTIIGKDPMQVEYIWEELYKGSFWGEGGGAIFYAGMSAIDIALMDIKGKVLKVPCYELIGGLQNDNLRCYASQLQFGWTTKKGPYGKSEDYVMITEHALSEGYDAIKIDFTTFDQNGKIVPRKNKEHVGTVALYKQIEERMCAIRKKYPDLDIICENHATTSVETAIRIGELCDKYKIMVLEEPLNLMIPGNHVKLYEKVKTPLAIGERVFTRWQYYNFLKDHTIGLIQPDACTCGGITETKKVCDLAHIFDIGAQVHVAGGPISSAASLQIEAAISNFCIHEHHFRSTQPCIAALAKYDYQPKNGRYEVPKLPGIGQEISDFAFKTALAKSTIE